MRKGVMLFLVGLATASLLFPLQAPPEAKPENSLQSDKRLAQTVSWQGVNQPIRRVLESLSGQLKVSLRADSKTASLRFTMVSPPRAAYELMGLIAKVLNAKWLPNGGNYLLVRSMPPQLPQVERDKLHHGFHMREWQEHLRERNHQTNEFFMNLLDASRLTDEQVLELVRRYPLISHSIENSKESLMCARLVTWLTKEQRAQAFIIKEPAWGVRLTPEDVRKTGSDYDLGFTYVSISIRPDLNPPFQCNIVWIPTDPNDKSKTTMTVAF